MKPSELYTMEPERRDCDTSGLFGCYFSHMPEIDNNWSLYVNPTPNNTRIEIRYYKDHCYDGRRIWRLASVWFDGKPFMIIRNAGREGDDHADRFVTDVETYRSAVVYLKSLLPPAFANIKDVVDADTDIKNLTKFYSDSLETAGTRW